MRAWVHPASPKIKHPSLQETGRGGRQEKEMPHETEAQVQVPQSRAAECSE